MELSQLAVPSVYFLIFFLGYPSQWMLMHLEPGSLTKNEIIVSNIILILIWVSYTKSVFVDPGTIPKDWADKQGPGDERPVLDDKDAVAKRRKWCRKCDAAKPPRAHHCKECKRCIPKMDHHCPWTSNCVSHTTFPHFLRFLIYTTLGLSLLQYFLFTRLSHLWSTRAMPAYLGPHPLQLSHLFITLVVNTFTLFALAILLLRNLWSLAANTTTIETWEIQRHRTLLRRARHFGGYLDDPHGRPMHIKSQEFPYDIGIWANIVQGMGGANPLHWLNPFAATPSLQSGLVFGVNGFEDEDTTWPPPDPDRAYKRHAKAVNADAFTFQTSTSSREDTLAAFKKRQDEDQVRRRQPFVDRLEFRWEREKDEEVERERELYFDGNDEHLQYGDDASDAEEDYVVRSDHYTGAKEGEEGWRNSEGERLQDFGVDEDVEFYDEQDDDIPLGEILARRQAAAVRQNT